MRQQNAQTEEDDDDETFVSNDNRNIPEISPGQSSIKVYDSDRFNAYNDEETTPSGGLQDMLAEEQEATVETI